MRHNDAFRRPRRAARVDEHRVLVDKLFVGVNDGTWRFRVGYRRRFENVVQEMML